MSKQIDLLPDDLDFVLKGQAAARWLGLTSINPPLEIYVTKPVMRPKIRYEIVDSLENFNTVYCKKGRCLAPEDLIIWLLKNERGYNPQVLPESVAMYQAECENGRFVEENLLALVEREGLQEKYAYISEIAETFIQ